MKHNKQLLYCQNVTMLLTTENACMLLQGHAPCRSCMHLQLLYISSTSWWSSSTCLQAMQTGELQSAVGLLASFDAQQTVDKICTHAGSVNILWKLACSLKDARSQTSDTHPSACKHMPGLSDKRAEQSKECNVLCKSVHTRHSLPAGDD